MTVFTKKFERYFYVGLCVFKTLFLKCFYIIYLKSFKFTTLRKTFKKPSNFRNNMREITRIQWGISEQCGRITNWPSNFTIKTLKTLIWVLSPTMLPAPSTFPSLFSCEGVSMENILCENGKKN